MSVVERILKWDTLLIVGLFILSVILMVNDPLGLNPEGPKGDVAVALYALPAVVVWLLVYVIPFHKKKK
jgi:hypothetical protein